MSVYTLTFVPNLHVTFEPVISRCQSDLCARRECFRYVSRTTAWTQ